MDSRTVSSVVSVMGFSLAFLPLSGSSTINDFQNLTSESVRTPTLPISDDRSFNQPPLLSVGTSEKPLAPDQAFFHSWIHSHQPIAESYPWLHSRGSEQAYLQFYRRCRSPSPSPGVPFWFPLRISASYKQESKQINQSIKVDK